MEIYSEYLKSMGQIGQIFQDAYIEMTCVLLIGSCIVLCCLMFMIRGIFRSLMEKFYPVVVTPKHVEKSEIEETNQLIQLNQQNMYIS